MRIMWISIHSQFLCVNFDAKNSISFWIEVGVWTDPHYTPAPVNNRLSDRLSTGKRSGYIKSHPQTAAIENNTSPANRRGEVKASITVSTVLTLSNTSRLYPVT